MADLTDIAGLRDLWSHTWGDPDITIAVLDGAVDLDRACFRGARFTTRAPYWQDPIGLDPDALAVFLEILSGPDDDETKVANLEAAVPNARTRISLLLAFHATHISSTIFGQPASPVEGVAPRCTGLNIPIAYDEGGFIDPLNLTRAIEAALEAGAHIIHVAACHPTQSGMAHDLLARAVRQCQAQNVLIVAPAGNDQGECWCIPAVLPGVLTVGAMRDNGQPFRFSNWGGRYQTQGVMAPGEEVLGAQPGTDTPARHRGTSCAAPIVTGVAALLLSRQRQLGQVPDPEAVRAAMVHSAIPCDPAEVDEPERCLRGRLNVPGAVALLTGTPLERVVSTAGGSTEAAHAATACSAHLSRAEAAASAASPLVYALGTLGYDFETEARRDAFTQLMPAVEVGTAAVSANPYDARQMMAYLAEHGSDAAALIWTLNLESIPMYALQPTGPFADEVYAILRQLLAGQVVAAGSAASIERVSIPGRLTDRTVRLFSGQEVPVLTLVNRRGIYGWQTETLVNAVLGAMRLQHPQADEPTLRQALHSFLNRVYDDLRNEGRTSRDRALNFAATNAFQAASTLAEAVASGLELDRIEADKSPFCRTGSDCWDVKLIFFDPDNGHRARKVYRFTIDVADRLPVTLDEVRSWSVPH